MALLPVIHSAATQMPVIAGQEQFAVDMFNRAFEGFSSTYRFLRPRKMDFQISSGATTTTVNNGDVVGVLLGVAQYDHCTWYERAYQQGQEPEKPDLCWVRTTPDTFPDALPAKYRQKIDINGVERWGFRIARRTVWSLLAPDPATGQVGLDLDSPVILDITSASMFGKSDPRTNSYKWAGLRQYCDSFSTPACQCSPLMFYIQINIDPLSPVPGVVVFRPMHNKDNAPVFLDNDTYSAVIAKAQSSTIAEMLEVKEILTYGAAQPAAPQQPVAPQPAPMQAATAPAAPQPAPEQPQHVAAPQQQAPAAPAATTQPVTAFTQPSAGNDTAGLLHQAQALLQNRAAAPAAPATPVAPATPAAPVTPQVATPIPPQPAAPAAQPQVVQPKVSAAASAGIANIMGSLGDF